MLDITRVQLKARCLVIGTVTAGTAVLAVAVVKQRARRTPPWLSSAQPWC